MESKYSSSGILISRCNPNIISNDQYKSDVVKLNSGSIFRINDKNFILSCYHCIKNSSSNLLMNQNESYKCSVVCIAPELDLGLLLIDDNINTMPYNMNDSLELPLADFIENQKFEIETPDIDEYMKSGKCVTTNIECTFYDIIQSSHISLNIPKMPFIRVNLNRKYNDISQLSGISGSIVKIPKTNKIIGMISSIIDTYVYIIPACCIQRFLIEFGSTSQFNGISSLVIKTNACMFEPNELKSKLTYGIFVNDTYGVKSNLMKNDIIVQINGYSLNVNNKIYDPVAKYLFDFNVYIALNIISGTQIPLKIARLKRGTTSTYIEKDISVDARSLNSMKYIPIESNKKIYEFSHMTFMELSEDIINYYIDLGILTGKSISDKYISTPYRNIESFIVILIHIDKTHLTSKIKKNVIDIGLPLVPIKNNQYSFTVISKINNTTINSLKDIIALTNCNISDVVINATVHDYGKLNIIIKNNDIINIIKGK